MNNSIAENPVKIENIKVLMSDFVRMKDKAQVENKLNSIISDGKEKLQIITDFDRTITKQHAAGKIMKSSFVIFSLCTQHPKGHKEKDEELCKIYRPIEIDPTISYEKKVESMIEWYKEGEKLYSGYDFQMEELDEVVAKEDVPLRDGTSKMLQSLERDGVPVLVFSAGLGDSVSAILRHHKLLLPNMHIISNFLRFNGSRLNGFQGEYIHTLNKNEHAVKKSDYFQVLISRMNVILLGDEIGDANMADGVQNAGSILKIGFLYDLVEERLEEYMSNFDIVLIDDQTMDVANEIIDMVLSKK